MDNTEKLTSLLAGTLGGMVGGVLVNNTRAVEITGNIQSTASYIIYQENGITKAQNGTSGEIEFTESEISSIINKILLNLTSGGTIFIKSGIYPITSTISNTTSNMVKIKGEGRTTVLIVNGDIDIISINIPLMGQYIEISDMALISINTRFGGAGIRILGDTYECKINNIYMENLYDGISISPSLSRAESLYVKNLTLWNTTNKGIYINNLTGGFFEDIVMWNGNPNQFTGIYIAKGDGLYFTNVDIMKAKIGFMISPTTGSYVKWLDTHNIRVDTGYGDGLVISGEGYITSTRFESFWASNNIGNGVLIDNPLNLSNVLFSDVVIQSNYKSGMNITNGTNIQIKGGTVTQNAMGMSGITSEMQGIYITNTQDTMITELNINNVLENVNGHQEYGIYLYGNNNRMQIIANNLYNSGTLGNGYQTNLATIVKNNIGIIDI